MGPVGGRIRFGDAEASRDLVERSASRLASRNRRDIMRQLEKLAADMPIPRYKASPYGASEGGAFTHGGAGRGTGKGDGEARAGAKQGSAHGGTVVTLFTRPNGSPVDRVKSPRIPEIKPEWVSQAEGTRVPPLLEDRAATFLPRQAVVQLSEDFRGYHALVDYFRTRYGHIAGSDVIAC